MYETLHGTYLYSIIHLSEIQIIWASWVWWWWEGGCFLFNPATLSARDSLGVFSWEANTSQWTLMTQCLRLRLPLALTSMKGTEVSGLCMTQPADETCLVL